VSRDDAVERRGDLRISEIDGGKIQAGLRAFDRRVGLIELGLGILDARLRGELALTERRLARVLGLRVALLSLVGGERRLRLRELGLIGVALDDEEHRALLHQAPVLIIDLLEVALNACFEIDRVERLGVAGELDVTRHRPPHRLSDHDLRRGRRNVGVLVLAGRKGEEHDNSGKHPDPCRPQAASRPRRISGHARHVVRPPLSRSPKSRRRHPASD
jgi:hypothetical protein